MKNISEIMSASTNNTLLLFDEIGSGTEPNEGAALAIAILEEFYQMGCITVATTQKAPTTEDGQVEDGTETVEEEGKAEETEAPTAEEGQVDGSQNQEDDSSTWVDETYQFIGDGYQSVIWTRF